jgi:hypothetical protein
MAVQRPHRSTRRVVVPQHVDQPLAGDGRPGVQGEHPQNRALPGALQVPPAMWTEHLDRSEHPKIGVHHLPSRELHSFQRMVGSRAPSKRADITARQDVRHP